ncbi:efflux RND transporter periplasmic adaptor subunit [Bacillus sp. AGMB 02131]|uniref:Efflux RND transporter periplasmic adaptor subunit n=1 Tax=Peribacillus faecalis TaxID=2772559 RepID=A0A927CVK6_9BACI|nr:efflux RND transporter periplasmic adaptor subunit [Peribacillus faecalis]MBD3108316.1 efflux RND transporter periplasmic adaptor subunit [Peribacillus faecalis]
MIKKKWFWIVSVVIVGIVIGIAVFFFRSTGSGMAGTEPTEMVITVQKAKNQELTESILATGKIVPEREQKVFWEAEKGEIVEYKATENQVVKAGDPLFVYDATKINNEYNKAIRERDLLQKRSKTEQAQISEFGKRITQAQKKASDGEAEDVNQLTSEKIQMEIQYEGTKAEITSIQEQINELSKQLKDMTVVSKIDGLVVKVNQNIEKNESGANEPVVHIISNSPFKVIGSMSEFDTVKIKESQDVIIRPKVFKDREWNGVVESISQFPDSEGGSEEMYSGGGGGSVTMYPFKVAITDDTSELRQGFHVSLEIKVSGQDDVLAVPHMALTQDEEGMNIVYVLVDGLLQKRTVETGIMNDEFIEIKEGVALDELVVIMPDEGMFDGMEVTSYDEIE